MIANAVFSLLLATSSAATPPPEDPALTAVLAKADDLEKEMKFGEAIDLLMPYKDSQNGELEFQLAFANMELALDGRRPDQIPESGIAEAIRYANLAIQHGTVGGYHILGVIYSNGWGVSEDLAKGMGYLKKGTELGDQGSRLNLAIAYYWGNQALPRNFSEACELFRQNLAEDPQDVLSVYYMGRNIYFGHCDRPADKKAGMELIQLAAEHGVRDAMRDMGESFEYGWVGDPDFQRAFKWYQKAADRGEPHAQWRIGMAYVKGELGPKDSAKGVQYLEGSAASDDANGLTDLGVMYATGDGVSKDFDKARSLYERAAALGKAHAFRELATMYANGEGVDVDMVHARVLYLQSVELGEADIAAFRAGIESNLDASQIRVSDQQFEDWRQARTNHQ